MNAPGERSPAATRTRLEFERDFLLASLADLETERAAGDLDDADYRTLHDDYTARAAAVLRALNQGPDQPGLTSEPAPAGRPGTRRRLVVTLTVVAVIVALAVGSVLTFAGSRPPGQPLTGSVPQGPSGQVAQAIGLERGGDAVGALKLYDEILRDDPDNVEALAYRGWLLKRAGLVDEALASLDRAVAVDPGYPDAHFFRGMVLFQDRDDPAGAVAEFRIFLASDPPAQMVPLVENVLRRAEAEAAGAPPATDEPPR